MFPILLASILVSEPVVTKEIVYSTPAEGMEMKLDFYKAVTGSDQPTPLVLVIHGGAWIQGKRQDMAPLAEAIAKQGMSAATISYRLAPKSKWPAMMDDCQAAVRFFRAKAKDYGIDPNRIGAAGASAGGHLSLLIGSRDNKDAEPYKGNSSRVKAVLNLFGPTDLSTDFNPGVANLVAFQVLGKPLDQAAQEIKDFSPVNHITKSSAPTFTIQGKLDTLVPFKQAERLAEVLKKAGVEHETVFIEKMGHELPIEKPEVMDALQKGLSFLIRQLKS